jgi:hypothetical protein
VSQTLDTCRAKCRMLRHSAPRPGLTKRRAPVFNRLPGSQSERSFGSDSALSPHVDWNQIFENARLPARRNQIRYDATTGEIFTNVTGAAVPAGWTSPQSSPIAHRSSPPVRAGHDPRLHCLHRLPHCSPCCCTNHHRRPRVDPSKNGSSAHGNSEEEKNQ